MTDPVVRAQLLPADYANANRAVSCIVDVDGRLDDIDTASILSIKDVDTTPSGYLPYLAWEAAVDVWNPSWTDAVKRAVIKASPDIKRHKGTVYAVKQSLGSFGLSATVCEWWQAAPRAQPYTFDVQAFIDTSPMTGLVTGPFLSDQLISDAYGAVIASKRDSTAFSMRVIATFPARLGLVPVAVARSRIAIAAHPAPVSEDLPASIGIAAVAVSRVRVSVLFIASP